MNNLAFLLATENRNMDEALQLAQRAISKVPQNPEYQDTLAWVYIRKGMPQNAIPILSTVLRGAPNQAEYHFHLASALAATGKTPEARNELRTALANKPTQEERAGIQALMSKLGIS
jgi:predicted Zn-dependent protease